MIESASGWRFTSGKAVAMISFIVWTTAGTVFFIAARHLILMRDHSALERRVTALEAGLDILRRHVNAVE